MTGSEKKSRSLASRAALFVLQGPRKPWWVTPAILAVSLMVCLRAAGDHPEDWALRQLAIALPFLAATGWWMVFRFFELQYWRGVAEAKPGTRCINCGYELTGLPSERCPECGVEQAALIGKAKRLTGERPGQS